MQNAETVYHNYSIATLKCVTVKGKYVTLNSVDFVSKIKNTEVKRGYTPMSFDVTSLFTKVPIQLTLCYMKEKLENELCWKDKTRLEIQDIIMLTELCLKGNYFQFKDTLYEQQEGAAMGSPISPIFAEFFMQKLEENLIPTLFNQFNPTYSILEIPYEISIGYSVCENPIRNLYLLTSQNCI